MIVMVQSLVLFVITIYYSLFQKIFSQTSDLIVSMKNSTSGLNQSAGPMPEGHANQSDVVSGTGTLVVMYFSLVIIPIGFILNSFCLIIFVKTRIFKSATGIHLTCMAVADNVILVALFLYSTEDWSQHSGLPNFRNYGFFSCTGSHFAGAAGLLWSGMLLASATIERFLAVAIPFKVKTWDLYRKSKMLMFVYFVIACILTGYEFLCYSMQILPSSETEECLYSKKYAKICRIFDTVVNSVLSNGICFCLILVFSVLTSFFLWRAKAVRIQLNQSGESESNMEFQVTLMLVTVAFAFLVFRIPEMVLYQMRRNFKAENTTNSASENAESLHPVFLVLVLFNHSVNFLIYVTFLETFRKTFPRLFKCPARKTATNSSSVDSTSHATMTMSTISQSSFHQENLS